MQRNTEEKMIKDQKKILITKPNKGGSIFAYLSALMVKILGSEPKIIEPSNNYRDENFDGVVISGGTDVNPSLYNSNVRMKSSYDNERDLMEKYLIEKSVGDSKPILGICRGAQMINVTLGGDLYSDVKMVSEEAEANESLWRKLFNRRRVNIFKNSKLWQIYKSRKARVNSIHNQSIGDLGEGLKVSAVEHNGVIQAIENEKFNNFILGVQWHPELMIYNKENRDIFNKFISSC